MKECPHCFTRVLPQLDGTCPSCLKNVNDTDGADLNRVLLVIPDKTKSPNLCCNCGQPTNRKVVVISSEDGTEADYSGIGELLKWILFIILAPLLLLVFKLRFLLRTVGSNAEPTTTARLRVKLGQCHECAHLLKPEPHSVSFRDGTMRFVVHREYADEFRRQILNDF